MPLYEYECGRCGHRFERIQRFSDPLVEECPLCEGPVRKLISAPAIQFKGDGWYVTDYARKEEKQKASRLGSKAKGSAGEKAEKKSKKSTGKDKEGKKKSPMQKVGENIRKRLSLGGKASTSSTPTTHRRLRSGDDEVGTTEKKQKR